MVSRSTRLPPMWPGFDSPCRRHKWFKFVGSLLCTERQGPSCSSLDQIPDMRVAYIRFIEPAQSYSATRGHEAADFVPGMKRKQQTQFKGEPSPKKKKSCVREMVAKCHSVVEMLSLGKVIHERSTDITQLYTFDVNQISWTQLFKRWIALSSG